MMPKQSRALRYTQDPLELLERVLNKTTLTTRRVEHQNVVEEADKILVRVTTDQLTDKEQAVKEAVEAAEARATRELKAALTRQKSQMENDKKYALEKQKNHYETLARRVAVQRDRLEEEGRRELTKKLQQEKEEALKEQWEEAERLKEIAIKEACDALRIQLRNDFVLEKEKAIAAALAKAREQFRLRELETIKRVTAECEKRASEEAARVAQLHREDIQRHQIKYSVLYSKYLKELDHKERVEQDFWALQDDYRRFMNYTDGTFHSDYMMMLREYGMKRANKRVSAVTYEDIQELDVKKGLTSPRKNANQDNCSLEPLVP